MYFERHLSQKWISPSAGRVPVLICSLPILKEQTRDYILHQKLFRDMYSLEHLASWNSLPGNMPSDQPMRVRFPRIYDGCRGMVAQQLTSFTFRSCCPSILNLLSLCLVGNL